MGLGRFGGGAGVTRWLVEQGADVLITDMLREEQLAEPLGEIADLVSSGRVSLRLGGHNVSDFTDRGLIVVNPAVPKPWDNRFVRAARASGARVTTEIVLLCERLPNPVRTIAVTGSNGKSTTSAMIHHALEACGERVLFGGNIGGSLLSRLPQLRAHPSTRVVLELSSAMLWWLHEALGGWSPAVAVVTNFSPNHMDWHGDAEHYRASKRRLLEFQKPGDAAVIGVGVRDWPTAPGVRRVELAPDAGIGGLAIPGAHNRTNAAAAFEAVRLAAPELDPVRVRDAVLSFPGLPHRLAFVGSVRGVKCYNDSKATTPEAATLAVRSLQEDGTRVHLIAGGYDKMIGLSPMFEPCARLAGVYTIGATGPVIAAGVRAAGGTVVECGELSRAVREALARAAPGEAVLLSPACASWDQFDNYEQRGDRFAELVREEAAG